MTGSTVQLDMKVPMAVDMCYWYCDIRKNATAQLVVVGDGCGKAWLDLNRDS
jgi:hypothetical protein